MLVEEVMLIARVLGLWKSRIRCRGSPERQAERTGLMARRVTQPVDTTACGSHGFCRTQAPGLHELQCELTSLLRFRERGRKKSAVQVALAAGRCCSEVCPPSRFLVQQDTDTHRTGVKQFK